MKIIIAILIFSAIILFHELGHFLFAKKNNVKVNEFCLGFGPTIISWGKGETKYSIKLLWLGGACMMEGEDSESKDDRAFNRKTPWERFQIVFGGPLFNFILAYIMAVVFLNCVGIDSTTLKDVMDGYPAQEAGIQAGDTILALDGYRVHFYQEISVFNYFHYGEPVEVTYLSNGVKNTVLLTPRMDEESGRYLFGFTGGGAREQVGLGKSLVYGLYEIKYQVYVTFKSLSQLITGRLGVQDMSGPVGIVSTIGDVYEESAVDGAFYVFVNMLSIAILLSANLGVMNLLPLPALDGGRLVFIIVEAVRGKKVDEELEGKVHLAGFALLMVLMIFIMYNDIVRLFTGM